MKIAECPYAPHVVDLTLATKKIFPRLPLLTLRTFLNRLHCSLLQYREVWEVDGCKLTHKLNCKLLKKRRFTSKGCRGSCKQKSDVTRKNDRHLSAVQKMHRYCLKTTLSLPKRYTSLPISRLSLLIIFFSRRDM